MGMKLLSFVEEIELKENKSREAGILVSSSPALLSTSSVLAQYLLSTSSVPTQYLLSTSSVLAQY